MNFKSVLTTTPSNMYVSNFLCQYMRLSHKEHIVITCNIKARCRNNQHYALICTTPLFCILAPTCFGSSLPLSGSFLDPSELLEIQVKWVLYHKMCGYVASLSWFRWFREHHDTTRPSTIFYRLLLN
jgi:hypothetical protein